MKFLCPTLIGLALSVVAGAGARSIPEEVIVNTSSPGFSTVSGNWFPTANPGSQGPNSLISLIGDGGAAVRWTAEIPVTGEYEVFAWWVAAFNRTPGAPYRISTRDGLRSVTVDQTTGGSRWNSLGTFTFQEGDASVELNNGAPPSSADATYVSADAVRFVWRGEAEPPPEGCPFPVVETSFESLGGGGNCAGLLLPGRLEPHPVSRYMIHSDMPERFSSEGVLYATIPVLPEDGSGSPAPLELRTQSSNGFSTVDDDFDVFLFHISTPGDGSAPRRLVVYARNDGPNPVTLQPAQVMQTTGVVGNIHEMESTLGRRWMEEDLARPLPEVTVPPGEGAVVAYSSNFAGFGAGIDANVNCFGLVRVRTITPPEGTDLSVFVVAIPAGPQGQVTARTEELLSVAAVSAEASIDITTPPPPSALRRATGVFENFLWRSDPVVLDAATLPPGGRSFQIALSEIQAAGCPAGRQTAPMILHPGYVHGDTIGNYHVDYRMDFLIVNNDSVPRAFDIRFGRGGADVGLAWQTALGNRFPDAPLLDGETVLTGWAGPNQDALTRTMLADEGGRVTLRPCSEVHMSLRFQVLGNSSLPFQISILPEEPGPLFGPELEQDGWLVN